jgi:CSLREA domain-containing protein
MIINLNFKRMMFVFLAVFVLICSTQAATLTVTKTADTNDGVCNADCSLREAVFAANQDSIGGCIIKFSALFDTPQTIQTATRIVILQNDVEIQGKGSNLLTIRGSGNEPIFTAGPLLVSPRVVIRDLRMTNGKPAIIAEGSLKIYNCLFDGNSAFDGNGGGAIFQFGGQFSIYNSKFVNNSAPIGGAISAYNVISIFGSLFENNQANDGGAIYSGLGTGISGISIENSTLKNNVAVNGGAVYMANQFGQISGSTFSGNSGVTGSVFYNTAGTVDFSNTTISENLAPMGMGRTFVVTTDTGTITMTNVTATRNVVRDSGTTIGKFGTGGQISIKNTIVADNINLPSFAFADKSVLGIFSYNVIGVTSQGHNIVGFAFPNDGFPIGSPNANGDFAGDSGTPFNPLLGVLANNGGETQTNSLLTGSAAINNGTAVGSPATDQRGVARPQGVANDIGAFETGVPIISGNTPVGSPVTVSLGSVSVTFAGVSTSGTTTQIPISPSVAGTLPGGFSLGSGLPAVQITTTAVYSSPITICIQVPAVTSIADFNRLTFFHTENGVLVDRTFSRDFTTKMICARTTSLSPFVVAKNLAPTAANVSISGRVITPNGRGINRTMVTITNQNGEVKTSVTNSFGFYRFSEIESGQTYIIQAISKRYLFSPQVIVVNETLENFDFTAM